MKDEKRWRMPKVQYLKDRVLDNIDVGRAVKLTVKKNKQR